MKTSHQMKNQPKMALKPRPLAQSQMILKYLIETYPLFLFSVLIARLSVLTSEIEF